MRNGSDVAEERRAGAAAKDGLLVLVADDSPFHRKVLSASVASENIAERISEAGGGEEALRTFVAERPDLVLLDWQMPDMEGPEVAKRMRDHEKRSCEDKRAYIIMITGVQGEDALLTAFDSGMDDFLRKPVSPAELSARLRVGKRTALYIRKLAEQKSEMEKVSRVDSLTGLYNRKYGEERLFEMNASSARSGRPFSVCFCDLNGFKRINDEHGHDAGDCVLRETARFIRSSIRACDVAVRWGGDEFLLLFSDAGKQEATAIMSRIEKTFAALDFNVGCEAKVKAGVSAGCVYGVGDSSTGCGEFVAAADALLYEAKKTAKNNPRRRFVNVIGPFLRREER